VSGKNSGPRFHVLDCIVSRRTRSDALKKIRERLDSGDGGYVCFANVHTVVTARYDPELRSANNGAFMTLPDGKPIWLLGHLQGYRDLEHIPGPDFLEYCLSNGGDLRHFFFGSTEQTLKQLQASVSLRYPAAKVVGAYSPPFGTLSTLLDPGILRAIREAKPDLIWVGLGAPKQELWMAAVSQDLRPAVLLGVGAAFDFHAGTVRRAPRWLRACGLEWLHRLASEPRRLWKRYLVTNTLFLSHLFVDLVRSEKSVRSKGSSNE